MELFGQFKGKWENQLLSAVKCLGEIPDACLTFFNFPEEEMDLPKDQQHHRETHKEFQARTKPWKSLQERVLLHSPCFIALKMSCIESSLWKSAEKPASLEPTRGLKISHKIFDTTVYHLCLLRVQNRICLVPILLSIISCSFAEFPNLNYLFFAVAALFR